MGSRILKRVELRPLNDYPLTRRIYDKKDKKIFARLKNSKLSSRDLAYFIGYKSEAVCLRLPKRKIFRSGQMQVRGLSYKRAFEIFEAESLGFNRKETSELLGLQKRSIEYAFKHKKEIVGTLAHTLSLIHGENIPKKYGFLYQ